MSGSDFLNAVRKGQVYVHKTLGKVKILGVAKTLPGPDGKVGMSLQVQRLNPPVETAEGKILETFASGVLRLHQSEPRIVPQSRPIDLT